MCVLAAQGQHYEQNGLKKGTGSAKRRLKYEAFADVRLLGASCQTRQRQVGCQST
jgi:hypothetical protein